MNGLFSDVHGTKLDNIQRQESFLRPYMIKKVWEHLNSQGHALMDYRKFPAQVRLNGTCVL